MWGRNCGTSASTAGSCTWSDSLLKDKKPQLCCLQVPHYIPRCWAALHQAEYTCSTEEAPRPVTSYSTSWLQGATVVHSEQVHTKLQNGLTVPCSHLCSNCTRCRAKEYVTEWLNCSFPPFHPLKNMNRYSPHWVTVWETYTVLFWEKRAQQRKDISFRYAGSFQCSKFEIQDWTCSNTFHNKALDKGLYICIDAFSAASGTCKSPFLEHQQYFGVCLMSFFCSFLNATAIKLLRKIVYIHAWKEISVPILSFPQSFSTANNCKAVRILN